MAAMAVSIEDLQQTFDVLRRALAGRDAAAILSATRAVRGAVDELRAADGGRMDPALRARLEALAPEIDAVRVQLNLASDTVRQRMARLAQRGVETAAPMTYSR